MLDSSWGVYPNASDDPWLNAGEMNMEFEDQARDAFIHAEVNELIARGRRDLAKKLLKDNLYNIHLYPDFGDVER